MIIIEKKKFVDAILSKKSFNGFQLPTKIYKFVSFGNDDKLNQNKITAFRNNQVYLSSPLNFNDPFDCQLSMELVESLDEFLKLGMNRKDRRLALKNKRRKGNIKKEITSLQSEIVIDWNNFRQQMLACCFTESWDNFLMWSHYANSYNGVCIEYDMCELLHNKELLLPVLYTDKLIATKNYLCKSDFQKNEPELLYKAGIYAILSKHLSWSYENEWRLVKIEDSPTNGKLYSISTPSSIYFGHNLNNDIKSELIESAIKLRIKNLYDISISRTEYKLINREVK